MDITLTNLQELFIIGGTINICNNSTMEVSSYIIKDVHLDEKSNKIPYIDLDLHDIYSGNQVSCSLKVNSIKSIKDIGSEVFHIVTEQLDMMIPHFSNKTINTVNQMSARIEALSNKIDMLTSVVCGVNLR